MKKLIISFEEAADIFFKNKNTLRREVINSDIIEIMNLIIYKQLTDIVVSDHYLFKLLEDNNISTEDEMFYNVVECISTIIHKHLPGLKCTSEITQLSQGNLTIVSPYSIMLDLTDWQYQKFTLMENKLYG